MFHIILGLVHIVVCIALVFFILIQSNKGMGLSGAFGAAGASDSVFGAAGGLNVLIKITLGLCVVFVFTCSALSFVKPAMNTSGSVVDTAVQTGSIQDLVNTSRAVEGDAQLPAGQPAPTAEQTAPQQ
jgi:preprotein translocase subunit SecG